MSYSLTKRSIHSRPLVVLAALAAVVGAPAASVRAQAATQPAAPADVIGGINADSFYGKEPTEGVYVRDSAGAVEKLALAQKMERLKEWNKSADLYQEVIIKYADRVVPSQLDKDKKIYQYTSITNPVQERLSHWPQEGLDVYRSRFETAAQTLLDNARVDDVGTLNKVYSLYFVTEAGKQAGIRLIDLYLESGEFPAAAWLGDRLLTLHPGLLTERPAVLYRTALAYYYGGDQLKAKDRLEQLKSKFAGDRGIVRGKDVILADSLQQEIQAPVAGSQYGSADSWPIPWGDPSRSRISSAEGRPGARLYGIPLSKPNWATAPAANRDQLENVYEESVKNGETLGILPVTDRGELFFQDGQRVYGVSIESGVALPGWAQTYPNGAYLLQGVWGSPRANQLAVTLSEHEVLAIMGQPDRQSPQIVNMAVQGEGKLVCLDRETGHEKWIVALSQLPDSAKEARTLQMTGSPLVVGDSVLVMARGAKTQFEDCYVLAFDLSTGKHRWSTYIASASAGAFMWGMGGNQVQGDNTSHMAYANGRVYVQTNLGALSALDAYTGAVVWLDIYPTGRQAIEQRAFNPFGQGNGMQAPSHKPWSYNPVIVEDGFVFTLPTEGRHLLVYDAGTGVEVKRIDLKHVEQMTVEDGNASSPFDTLLGVIGDTMILCNEKIVLSLNWKNYTDAGFDPKHDAITNWMEPLATSIRGRGFITRDVVFIPSEYCLSRINLKSGKCIDVYPKYPEKWEAPEEPGNVLATNDHVVVAGAHGVNVYTDLALAKVKLDRELAAMPNDPQPRLRYAEVTFVAGEPDTALGKLDEAAQLMGGLKALAAGPNRDRLFNDALTFADKLAHGAKAEDHDRVVKLFDHAGAAANTPVQQVHYRLSRAKFEEAQKDFLAAVRLYQEILADPQLRPVPMAGDSSSTAMQADAVAEKSIAEVIKDHPGAYESFAQSAAAAMEQARASKEDAAGKLLELARTYPNSEVAGKAMIAAAEAYETANDPRHAIRVLRDMWFKYPESPDKARIQESIARNYLILASGPRESAGDTGLMDDMEAAAAALARAAALPGDPRVEKPLKLRDGTEIAVATPVAQALDQVRKFRVAEVSKTLPEFNVPVPPPKVPGQPRLPHPKAFLPQDNDRDIIPSVKALVLPIRDFSRSDRVVTYTTDGVINLLASGQIKPLATSRGITEEPKNCAWVGDTAIIWGGSQVVSLRAAGGDPAWKLDLREMQPIEVVRVSDNAQTVPTGPGDPNNVLVVGGGGRVIVRNGQRVVFNRGGFRPQLVVNPPPMPLRPAGGAEEINDVRPVGDHLVLTTTSGRILSLVLATGQIAWQTRLSDHPVDRLVAHEDFTVVRVSDEMTVRIAAFDTATGQMRCTRSWVVQSGMVPVNLALAADGTLVYTMPDRLCIKDLYKPWPDPSDKEVQAYPALPLFEKATQPDQLLIAEGRILALADNGSMKYVRVHSLESGQPVPLKYRSPQGDQDIDRILEAGKSDQVNLRVVGPHLYVINPYGVTSYNLDRPSEKWESPIDPESRLSVRETFVGQKFLVLLDEPPAVEDAAAPVPANGPVPVPNPPPAPNPQANPNGASAPPAQYSLQVFGRYTVSEKNPAESGRLDYQYTVSDPAGITPAWQAVDGGFYYLTADGKLHILRGSKP